MKHVNKKKPLQQREVKTLKNSLNDPQHKFNRRMIVGFLNTLYKNLPKKELPESINSIIIIAQEKLGDAILLLPFLKALNDRFPGIAIDLCCTSYNRKIFEGISFIRNCVSYRPYNLRFSKLIRSEQYDVLYTPKSGPSSTFHHITNKVNANVKVCLNDSYNNPIYNVHLPNDNKKHIAEKFIIIAISIRINPKAKASDNSPLEVSKAIVVVITLVKWSIFPPVGLSL